MGTHIPAGLLAADLTSRHVGEVLEIGKYYRINKKKNQITPIWKGGEPGKEIPQAENYYFCIKASNSLL